MKLAVINCSRSQLQWRTHLLCLSAALLFFVPWANAQTDAILQPIGGDGGGQFVARCPQGQHLTGVDLRVGDDVDAIRPICAIAYAPAEAGPLERSPSRFGGTGGGADLQLLCPRDAPIVTAMFIQAEGVTEVVNNIHLFCGVAAASQARTEYPSAVFDGPRYKPVKIAIINSLNHSRRGTKQQCPAGLVAVGINGRSGIWLDALGLICGAPRLTPKPAPVKDDGIRPRGREKTSSGTLNPPRAICDLARQARAQNSPAAPGLEEKCRAAGPAGEIAPVKPQDRVKASTGTLNPPRAVCDLARDARAQKSPAAPGLEEKCRADLAAKGAAMAQTDSALAAARNAEPDTLYRQGFDIATAIFGDPAQGALGNTATGPGSLGIRDSLSAAGQRGFNASVELHLKRNYKRPSGPSITIRESVGTDLVTVYTRGMTQMTVNVTWNAGPDYTYCEIYLSVDNGQWSEFARGRDGAKPAAIKLGSSHIFRMMIYEGQAGTPKIIKTLTVKGVL